MSDTSAVTISREEIIKLARLSSLELSEEEIDKYQKEVATILEMIGRLKEIDTEGVEPTYQVSGNKNVMREDVILKDVVSPDKLLGLSPSQKNNQIKVSKVL